MNTLPDAESQVITKWINVSAIIFIIGSFIQFDLSTHSPSEDSGVPEQRHV